MDAVVSVVVTSCRKPCQLRESIESILHQTLRIHEVLLVLDDLSGCNASASLGALPPAVHADARVRVLFTSSSTTAHRAKEHGYGGRASVARNVAIDMISPAAQWVCFVDDDDVWLVV